MINRYSRKASKPVELLKQGSFTGAKGIDENASVLDTSSVLYLKNFTTERDGTLTLRKPIMCVEELPEVRYTDSDNILFTEMARVQYLFDKNYKLIIRISPDGEQYFCILKNGVPVSVRLHWMSWTDYASYYTTYLKSFGDYMCIPCIDFSNTHFANTSNSTVVTGGKVNIAADVFRRNAETYPDNYSTDLFYSKLYDYTVQEGIVELYKPRTLIITKSTDPSVELDLKIVTPDINTIQSTDSLALDVNLDLDNPYAIRDVYNTSAPTVKNILAYVPTYTQNKHTVISPIDNSQTTDSETQIVVFQNEGRVPSAFDPVSFKRTAKLTVSPQTPDVSFTNPFTKHLGFILNVTYPDISNYRSDTICLNLCRDFSLNLSFNLWLHVLSEWQDGYILYRIGTGNVDYGQTVSGKDIAITGVPYAYASTLKAVTKCTAVFPYVVDREKSVTDESLISHFENLEPAKIGFMFQQYLEDSTKTVPSSVHGLSESYIVRVVSEIPKDLAVGDTGFVTGVHFGNLRFKYPTKEDSKYVWKTCTADFKMLKSEDGEDGALG